MHALVQKISVRRIDSIPMDVKLLVANGLPIITIVDPNAVATTSQVTNVNC